MKIHSAEFIKSCHQDEQFPRDRLPEIAFVGRSNVGKSSLINSLVTRKNLARISRTPGKTRAVNFYKVVMGGARGLAWYVVDLPGYGYAKVSKSIRAEWGPMVEAYLKGREELCGAVLLVDSRGPGRQDRPTLEWLHGLGLRTLVVATKIDKLTRSERSANLASIREALGLPDECPPVPYSSITHEGREAAWGALQAMIEKRSEDPTHRKERRRHPARI